GTAPHSRIQDEITRTIIHHRDTTMIAIWSENCGYMSVSGNGPFMETAMCQISRVLFVLLVLPIGIFAQQSPGVGTQPTTTFFGWYAQSPWFNDPGLRTQLKLQASQYGNLQRSYADLFNQYRPKYDDLGRLPADQRERVRQELNLAFSRDLLKSSEN